MEKEKRVILIDENILTEDLAELKNILSESVLIIKRTRNGVEAAEIKNAVKNIEEVAHVLDCLAQKKFPDAQMETLFLKP